jgi:hypothetical protein
MTDDRSTPTTGLAPFSEEPVTPAFPLRIYRSARRARYDETHPIGLFSADVEALDADLRASFAAFAADFDRLVEDPYMRDGSRYRLRRFSSYELDPRASGDPLRLLPPEPFYQDERLNAYSGGIRRHYEPLAAHTAESLFLRHLIYDLYSMLPTWATKSGEPWNIGVHLLRIVGTRELPGLPAPEGVHQDGHEFTSITLIRRENVRGAASIFTDLEKKNVILEHTLVDPLDTLLFDDSECMHDVTPVESLDGSGVATRDVCGFSLNPAARGS